METTRYRLNGLKVKSSHALTKKKLYKHNAVIVRNNSIIMVDIFSLLIVL